MRTFEKSLIIMLLALGACQGNEKPQTPATSASAESQPAMHQVAPNSAQPDAPVMEKMKKASPVTQAPAAVTQKTKKAAKAVQVGTAAAESAKPATAVRHEPVAGGVVESVADAKAKVTSSLPTGDAARGKKLARKCASCHDFGQRNMVGPHLGGVFGRKAGSVPGFRYKFSRYIRPDHGWQWDAAHLAAWVCNAKKALRAFTGDAKAKTKMPAQRICKPAQQADLIAFLRTL